MPRLSVFPDPATWSVRMRRAWLTLTPGDADLLRTELDPLLRPHDEIAALTPALDAVEEQAHQRSHQ